MCGSSDKTGSRFLRVTGRGFGEARGFFTGSGRINNRNHFSFLIAHLTKLVFQKTFINLICLIYSTLNNYYVLYCGLSPGVSLRIRQAGHHIMKNDSDNM